jgi:hypothetical protein
MSERFKHALREFGIQLASFVVLMLGTLTMPWSIFAMAIVALLAPFVWLAWYWSRPNDKQRLATLPHHEQLKPAGLVVPQAPQTLSAAARPTQGIVSLLLSAFFAAWAIVFAALTILLALATIGALLGTGSGYAAPIAVGCLAVGCGWLTCQIASAVWA